MRYGVAVVLFFVVAAGVIGTQPVGAEKPIFAQFKALYVKPKSTDRTMLIFNEAVVEKGNARFAIAARRRSRTRIVMPTACSSSRF